jgi:hypothetical protein
MYKISLFDSVTSRQPDQANSSWPDLVSMLTTFDERAEKGGRLWSPCSYPEGSTRKKDSVDKVCLLVLDFDGGHAPDDFLSLFEGYQYIIHSSHSNSSEHPKWRAVFPLKQPVPGAAWESHYRGLADRFGGGVTDEACKDASRIYFLPTHPAGETPFFYVGEGEPIDASLYLMPDEPLKAKPVPKTVAPGSDLKPGEDFDLRGTWEDALPGFTHVRRSGSLDYWCRPGKKEGISATTGPRDVGDRAVCFSSSTALTPMKAYTKFGAYATLEHGGDYATAASALARRGFGANKSQHKPNFVGSNSNLATDVGLIENSSTSVAYLPGVEPRGDEFNPGILLAFVSPNDYSHHLTERVRKFAIHFGEWEGLTTEFFEILKVTGGANDRLVSQTLGEISASLMRYGIEVKQWKSKQRDETRDKSMTKICLTGRISVQVNNRQLYDLGNDLFSLLIESNNPPRLFSRTGMIVTPSYDENQVISLLPVMGNRLHAEFSRLADFIKVESSKDDENKKSKRISQVNPPKMAVEYVETLFPWKGLPALRSLASCPVVTSSGVRRTSGYDWDQRVYVNLPADVPEWTGGDPVKFIFEELLCDFPFDSDASRANTLALMMLPILRPVIDGPTPLHLIEAPTQGTGKSLLAKVTLLSTLGQCGAMTVPKDEDSWSKKITSALVKGSPVIFIDNIAHKLDSESLAAVLTTTSWTDRILGQTSNVDVPNASVWVATSNNCKMSPDIARRTLYIRLDSEMEHPEERADFKHQDIVEFAMNNRLLILSALSEIAERWINKGRLLGREKMGSFESWAKVVGGCLAANGVEGFLSNREQLQSSANDERDIWAAVFAHCYEHYLDFPQSTSVIYDDLKETDFLSELGLIKTDEANKRSLGLMLNHRVGKIYGGTKLERTKAEHKSARFKFLQVGGTRGTKPSISSDAHAGAHAYEENQKPSLPDENKYIAQGGKLQSSPPSPPSQVQNAGGTSEIVEEVW